MGAESVHELIDSARRTHALTLVGIGGHGASGKSTLAAKIPAAQIVSTDAFWDGRAFELSRLRREVFEPLLRREQASYRVWDWTIGALGATRLVEPFGVVVVEGVCALHRMFRDDYAVRVWVDAPYDLRLARAVERDGEEARRTWVEVWMPSEDRYVERDDPVACAHVVVDGSGDAEGWRQA